MSWATWMTSEKSLLYPHCLAGSLWRTQEHALGTLKTIYVQGLNTIVGPEKVLPVGSTVGDPRMSEAGEASGIIPSFLITFELDRHEVRA